MWKEVVVAFFKVLSFAQSNGTEETTKDLSHNVYLVSSVLSLGLPIYMQQH